MKFIAATVLLLCLALGYTGYKLSEERRMHRSLAGLWQSEMERGNALDTQLGQCVAQNTRLATTPPAACPATTCPEPTRVPTTTCTLTELQRTNPTLHCYTQSDNRMWVQALPAPCDAECMQTPVRARPRYPVVNPAR